jgi:hypothetical protein
LALLWARLRRSSWRPSLLFTRQAMPVFIESPRTQLFHSSECRSPSTHSLASMSPSTLSRLTV